MLGSTSARSSIDFLAAAGRANDESTIQPFEFEFKQSLSELHVSEIVKPTPTP
jgi:hypothetical protein